MPRIARVVAPGHPHHVTQRGSRKQRTFFTVADYQAYKKQLTRQLGKTDVEVWAYCLMPNHVHLVLVPHAPDSLARLLRQTHSAYAKRVNEQHGWQGHLWQERFRSFVMDEQHLLAAVRYVEMNPVRSALCERPEDWLWSSVHFHMHDRPDPIMQRDGMRNYVRDWQEYLAVDTPEETLQRLREHATSGKPAGDEQFVSFVEGLTGRCLTRRPPGRPPKA